MGEVYRARDSRLNRTVALKIVHAGRRDDPAAQERLIHEARAISRLAHPHICVLHDMGAHEGKNYLVMEFLEGETLAARLLRGRLPLADALRYAAEVAGALDAAHRVGVVHGDLSPANVMITKTGAKVLDFGLARHVEARDVASSGITATLSPRSASPVGTLRYLAPEVLEGQAPDARSDVFALGTVLYEMITGRHAFDASGPASLIAAILQHDPPPTLVANPDAGAAVDRVTRLCLAKDPAARWQSAHDLAETLRWIAQTDPAPSSAIPKGRGRWTATWFLLVSAVVAILAFALASRGKVQRGNSEPMRLALTVPGAERIEAMAISPDGSTLAMVVFDGTGSSGIWIRRLDSERSRPLEGTENAQYPFWSPDGEWIAYFSGHSLRKIAASGGPPIHIAHLPVAGRGGTWNDDDVILFGVSSRALFCVDAGGGQPEPLTSLDRRRGESTHRWPHFLSDGEHFLYLRSSYGPRQLADYGIYLGSLRSKETKLLIRTNSNAIYAGGHILFGRGSGLFAVPFDLDRLSTTGPEVLIDDSVSFLPQVHWTNFAADQRTLVYENVPGTIGSELVWHDENGTAVERTGIRGSIANVRLSHDKKRIAFDRTDIATGNGDIWVTSVSSAVQSLRRMTNDPSFQSNPVWTADDQRIMFYGYHDGLTGLCELTVTGEAPPRCGLAPRQRALDVSPDGRYLLIRSYMHGPPGAVQTVSRDPGQDRRSVAASASLQTDGRWSPDGKFIAYVSDASGRNEVYLTRFPSLTGQWQVSMSGGTVPVWASDGKRIFYVASDNRLMSVAIAVGEQINVAPARALFRLHTPDPLSSTDFVNFDVSVDGQRFLVNTSLATGPAPPLAVALNWTTSLREPNRR